MELAGRRGAESDKDLNNKHLNSQGFRSDSGIKSASIKSEFPVVQVLALGAGSNVC